MFTIDLSKEVVLMPFVLWMAFWLLAAESVSCFVYPLSLVCPVWHDYHVFGCFFVCEAYASRHSLFSYDLRLWLFLGISFPILVSFLWIHWQYLKVNTLYVVYIQDGFVTDIVITNCSMRIKSKWMLEFQEWLEAIKSSALDRVFQIVFYFWPIISSLVSVCIF